MPQAAARADAFFFFGYGGGLPGGLQRHGTRKSFPSFFFIDRLVLVRDMVSVGVITVFCE